MKLSSSISRARVQTGYLLIECLVYISLFAVVTGLGMVAFYLCWENSAALRYNTDDIAAALHAGERWRADVRSATGEIIIEHTTTGELLRIPERTNEIYYRFNADDIRRQSTPSAFAEPMLTAVKASQMIEDKRGRVHAWRWELELKPHRGVTHLPLQFTFEAATKATP